MAIDNIDKLITGLAESTKLTFYKPSLGNKVSGELHSLWYINGDPSIGAIPTTAENCVKNLLGSWDLPTPVGLNNLYIGKFSGNSSLIGQLLIFDRLSHMGGLSGTDITTQTVDLTVAAAAAEGRCEADGAGVLWCVEHYIDTGNNARTLTVTYTNQADVTGRTTTVDFKANCRSGYVQPILPNDDDLYIKSIQSVILSGSTGTAGNFGITARKSKAELSVSVVGVGSVMDYADLGLPVVQDNECLELVYLCGGTSTGNITGSIEILEG